MGASDFTEGESGHKSMEDEDCEREIHTEGTTTTRAERVVE